MDKINIRNFRTIESIQVNLSQYTTIIGNDSVTRDTVIQGLVTYFQGKKLTSIEKEYTHGEFSIYDMINAKKVKANDKCAIYFPKYVDVQAELKIKAKSVLQKSLKQHMLTNGEYDTYLLTLSTLLEDAIENTIFEKLKTDIEKQYDVTFSLNARTLVVDDLLQYITIDVDEGMPPFVISHCKYKKLLYGLIEQSEKREGDYEYIYIIDQPETFLSMAEQKELKEKLIKLSEKNKIIVNTNSAIFCNWYDLNGLNIIEDNQNVIGDMNDIVMKIEQKSPYYMENQDEKEMILSAILQYVGLALLENPLINNEIEEGIFIHNEEKLYVLIEFMKIVGLKHELHLKKSNSPYVRYLLANK